MPLFDYHCEFCDKITEHLINANDPEPTCHLCKGSMIKLLSKPAHYSGAATAFVNHHLDKYGEDGKAFKD